MERYEQAAARRQQAQANEQQAQAPQVRTIADIKRVLKELDPSNKVNAPQSNTPIVTQMNGNDDKDRPVVFQVTANSTSKTHRDIIRDGIDVIRQRRLTAERFGHEKQEEPVIVNGRPMTPPPLLNLESALGVDPIIERVTGGYRTGELICWDLADGFTYKYNIFEHRLTRAERADPE
jgi:hypothetical protein